jgi:hypothetical protein
MFDWHDGALPLIQRQCNPISFTGQQPRQCCRNDLVSARAALGRSAQNVSVGTIIADRPPPKSVSGRIPAHPPILGVTGKTLMLRHPVRAPAHVTWLLGSVPSPCFAGSRPPWPRLSLHRVRSGWGRFVCRFPQLLWQSLTSRCYRFVDEGQSDKLRRSCANKLVQKTKHTRDD